MPSTWKGGGKLPSSKIEYEANARNRERLKHSCQFFSSPLITDAASSMIVDSRRSKKYLWCCTVYVIFSERFEIQNFDKIFFMKFLNSNILEYQIYHTTPKIYINMYIRSFLLLTRGYSKFVSN